MSVLDAVVVATDSEAVAGACRSFGAPVELTDPSHPSGTDRVAEAIGSPRYADFSIVVNVQGDEPFLLEDHVERAVELVAGGRWEIGTCATPLRTPEEFEDPSVVKVVRASDGRALYFSRAPIPFDRDAATGGADHDARAPARDPAAEPPLGLRHLGLYVYTREALRSWVSLDPSPLERVERLEQLRPLEAGLSIGVALVEGAPRGIDTPEDAARAEAVLRATHASTHAGHTGP